MHYTTVIHWGKQVGQHLPDAYDPETVPQVGELDELETFVRAKKTEAGSGQQLTTSLVGGQKGLQSRANQRHSPLTSLIKRSFSRAQLQ